MKFYKDKMDFHYKQWELAIENERTKTAEFHMREYLNYEEMYKQSIKGGPENER